MDSRGFRPRGAGSSGGGSGGSGGRGFAAFGRGSGRGSSGSVKFGSGGPGRTWGNVAAGRGYGNDSSSEFHHDQPSQRGSHEPSAMEPYAARSGDRGARNSMPPSADTVQRLQDVFVTAQSSWSSDPRDELPSSAQSFAAPVNRANNSVPPAKADTPAPAPPQNTFRADALVALMDSKWAAEAEQSTRPPNTDGLKPWNGKAYPTVATGNMANGKSFVDEVSRQAQALGIALRTQS